ncbi:leucine-rich repeat domain-containing protein [Flavivirga sp. 57AJ16]|uniref:leucine-rich repeat domain-containing protein n=1 Tax=Flavivirga sp. 57AJ16 TaxID=3025307 RepID=UPI002366E22A|nr:leucine-rich repeat domain-containing protein [Flavivirga sp. 57AJ16]MDD7888305.1 leucine-rich repeat domain-containing protein [Flavivirga sp. 57AJ16]
MKKHLQVLIFLMLPLFSISQTFEIEHINYQVTSTGGIPTVEIKESPKATGAIDIPETVTHQGVTYRVTAIGNGAFNGAFMGNALTSVTIPDSVTTIGAFAFYYNDLTSVTIPDSVTTVGAFAFEKNALTSVAIGNSVTTIGGNAFGRNPLTEVIVQSAIPASIEDTSFDNRNIIYLNVPESLKQVYINSGWTGFQDHPVETFTQDNVNYVKTGETSAIVIMSPKATGAIAIPETETHEDITYRVTAIGDSAFFRNALTSVTIPDSVTAIGNYAFADNALTSVTIPDSVTAIGNYAFGGNGLTSVVIPDSVTAIGDYVFYSNDLTSVTIPDGVTAIGYSAFRDNDLTSVTIPDSVTAIGDYAFSYNDLTSVVIPDSVTAIGDSAFFNNALTSVTIGNSVTAIGDDAFRGNDALDKVIAKSTTPTIYSNIFSNRAEIALIIPEGTKEAYETAGWTGFKSITEGDETLSITNKDLNTSVHLILNDSYLKIQSTQANLKAYTIYNIQGINVLKGTADKVAVDRLSSGMYIAVLSFDKGTISKKFIIE